MGRRIGGAIAPLPSYRSLEEMADDLGVSVETLERFAENVKRVARTGMSVRDFTPRIPPGITPSGM